MEKVYILRFDNEVTVTGIDYDKGIRFSDGTQITDYHGQDCCEDVYADWGSLRDTAIWDEKFKKIEITGKNGLGIVLNGEYAVNCYNYQNGYYSSELEIVIKQNGHEDRVDISKFVEDHID